MALVSIAVPVYNSEKYLETCVESLLTQTLKDIEIILVDDGSKDSSGRICDRYADIYGNIKVVHKPNGGPQSAVIAGIKAATADIIGFCDSDDFVSADYYETLYRAFSENDADMVSCRLKIIYDENDREYNSDASFMLMEGADILQTFWYTGQMVTGNQRYTKLFKKQLLYRVIEDMDVDTNIGEDAIQILCYLSECGRVCLMDSFDGYFYRQLDTSITNSFNEKMIRHNVNYIKAFKETAVRTGRDYKSEVNVTNSVLANLMYKCVESSLPVREKAGYVKTILSHMTDRHRFADKYLPDLNPVLKTGFRLIENKKIFAGTLFASIYIRLIKLFVADK